MKYHFLLLFSFFLSNSFSQGFVKIGESEVVLNSLSVEETQLFLEENINKFCFQESPFKELFPYKATFIGDYLRLVNLDPENENELNNELIFDFSNVYAFKEISKKSDKRAYLIVYVSVLTNEKKNSWDKHKLKIRVNNYLVAKSILNALKHYNSLLMEKDYSEKKGF